METDSNYRTRRPKVKNFPKKLESIIQANHQIGKTEGELKLDTWLNQEIDTEKIKTGKKFIILAYAMRCSKKEIVDYCETYLTPINAETDPLQQIIMQFHDIGLEIFYHHDPKHHDVSLDTFLLCSPKYILLKKTENFISHINLSDIISNLVNHHKMMRVKNKLHYDERWINSNQNPNRVADLKTIREINENSYNTPVPIIFTYDELQYEHLTHFSRFERLQNDRLGEENNESFSDLED